MGKTRTESLSQSSKTEAPHVQMPQIADRDRNKPQAYVKARGELLNLFVAGDIEKGMDYERMKNALAEECEANTGVPYEDAAKRGRDVIAAFITAMEHDEGTLEKLKVAIQKVRDLRVKADLKKKWLVMIDEVIALQNECREDPAKFMVYVGRNDEPQRAGQFFEMAEHHIHYFDVWNDPAYLHSLIEAPPGHAKSTCLRYQRTWEVGHRPELRCLYLTDEKEKAEKTAILLKTIIQHGRFTAIFPDIRVLTQKDNVKNKGGLFTVCRKNELARDATIESAGIQSRIQGNRYDRIDADDICPQDVRDHKTVRETINNKFFSVVKTRLDSPAYSRIRIIGTPWHQEDVLGRIAHEAQKGTMADWRVEIDPFRIKDDSIGLAIPIWDKFPVSWFEQQKVSDGRNYELTYRLKPSSDIFASVTRIRWYNSDPNSVLTTEDDLSLLDEIGRGERWLSLDPAGTTGKQSCDTGVVEISLLPDGRAYLTRIWRWHCAMDEVIIRTAQLIAEAPSPGYEGIHWEGQGASKGVIPIVMNSLRDVVRQRGCTKIPRMEMTGANVGGQSQNKSKMMRLQSCASMFFHGGIHFPGTRVAHPLADKVDQEKKTFCRSVKGSKVERLADSIKQFDGSMDADCIDAVTQWLLNNAQRIRSPYQPKAEQLPAQTRDTMTAAFHKQVAEMANPVEESAYRDEARVFETAFV